MNTYGWDEPPPYCEPIDTSDRDYGLWQDRIDHGDECPKCSRNVGIQREGVASSRRFVCACGCRWSGVKGVS